MGSIGLHLHGPEFGPNKGKFGSSLDLTLQSLSLPTINKKNKWPNWPAKPV